MGGGTVETQDPSGACGGLFHLIFSICITFFLPIMSLNDGGF